MQTLDDYFALGDGRQHDYFALLDTVAAQIQESGPITRDEIVMALNEQEGRDYWEVIVTKGVGLLEKMCVIVRLDEVKREGAERFMLKYPQMSNWRRFVEGRTELLALLDERTKDSTYNVPVQILKDRAPKAFVFIDSECKRTKVEPTDIPQAKRTEGEPSRMYQVSSYPVDRLREIANLAHVLREFS